jgi:hypothetical protein
MGGMAYVVEGGVGFGLGLGYALYVLFLAAPAPARGGGILAKIPTYGKHLSHNVYYGRDYVHGISVSH